jgi:hypothetical protein
MKRQTLMALAGLFVAALTLSVAAALPELSGSARRAEAGPLAKTFTFVNNSGQTIWVGALNNPGHPLPEGGGFQLNAGASHAVTLTDNWAGRFWPRTGCHFDAAGNGTCDTGDCARGLKCNGAGGIPPASLAEITMQGAGGQDFFDVSFVDGFNVPIVMRPIGGPPNPSNPFWCVDAGCSTNINATCPPELQKRNGAGQVVACNSACNAFNTDQFCCRGAFATPETCRPEQWPVNYTRVFKNGCPKAYSYAYDDPSSTFFCRDCNYQIIFGNAGPPPPTTTPPPGGGGNAYGTLQAENFQQQNGVIVEGTTDTGGGQNIGAVNNGNWTRYNGINFGSTPARQFSARVASGAGGSVSGLVELRLDSPTGAVLGSFAIANTGGWQSWRTVPANISPVTGTHDVYLTFTSGQPADFVNVNWFTFAH